MKPQQFSDDSLAVRWPEGFCKAAGQTLKITAPKSLAPNAMCAHICLRYLAWGGLKAYICKVVWTHTYFKINIKSNLILFTWCCLCYLEENKVSIIPGKLPVYIHFNGSFTYTYKSFFRNNLELWAWVWSKFPLSCPFTPTTCLHSSM